MPSPIRAPARVCGFFLEIQCAAVTETPPLLPPTLHSMMSASVVDFHRFVAGHFQPLGEIKPEDGCRFEEVAAGRLECKFENNEATSSTLFTWSRYSVFGQAAK